MKKKPPPGSIEWLRTFPSFKDCSDEEAREALKQFEKIAEALIPVIGERIEKEKAKKRKMRKK